MTGVLITRAEEDARDFAKKISPLGVTPLIAPLYEHLYLTPSLPDECPSLIVVTSSQALSYIRANLAFFKDCPFICVGAHTAKRLEALGINILFYGQDAASLIEMIGNYGEIESILYLRGKYIRSALKPYLQKNAGQYKELIIYETRLTTEWSPEIVEKFKKEEIGFITVFSSRGAENLGFLLNKYHLLEFCTRTKILSISASVLKSLPRISWQDMLIARTPDNDGIYTLLKDVIAK